MAFTFKGLLPGSTPPQDRCRLTPLRFPPPSPGPSAALTPWKERLSAGLGLP